MAFSKLGRVKIGGMDAQPEFGNFAWYSMLLSAGMGIGLMFWAVGEPLFHSEITPAIFQSENEVSTAMASTFFSLGFSSLGNLCLVRLGIGILCLQS